MTKSELQRYISQRINFFDIKNIIKSTDKEDIFCFVSDKNERISNNALWILTHLAKDDNGFLESKRDILIDNCLITENNTKRRLFLNLIERLDFTRENLRTDFLDFCLQNCVSPIQSSGIQSLCLKLAYKQCVLYDELLEELKLKLTFIHSNELSAGVKCQYDKILAKINKTINGKFFECQRKFFSSEDILT